MPIIHRNIRPKKPPKLKIKLCLGTRIFLSHNARKDGKKENAFGEIKNFILSTLIIAEIKKFLTIRDARLINHTIPFGYDESVRGDSLENWVNKIDNDIAKERSAMDVKINKLEEAKKELENILKETAALPNDLKQNAAIKKAAIEAKIEDTIQESHTKKKAALHFQLALIEETIKPFFESYLNYHIMRIDYYWAKARNLRPNLSILPPTRDMSELIQVIVAGETLLGRYEEKRDEIKNQLKLLEEKSGKFMPYTA